ncbi:sigma-54-dependent transcriptional regulator [Desulfovibrio legallii]|uniref:Two-component system, NtrC family, response regulator n=1 Tax=Desulfovibrio legallii TaxID=571438 RepID=A0A1G7PB35_9BACT|nr:sigma-54 dependent transcriptional regulator [Desulfovibrio legallii]SDF83431.1 two-component system, NtrC family, response regulator [Desulfovibrio legallii]
MARILIVDDEALMRTMATEACARLGHTAATAADLAAGLELGRAGADVVLLDVWLPDGNGLERQNDFAHLPGRPDVIIVTGHGDGDAVEAALRSGAWEFLCKPLRVRDIEQCLRQVLAFRQQRNPAPEALLLDSGHIAGAGAEMSRALKLLGQAARSEVNVLLLGETGVGKEVFAKALYRNSPRAARPLVTVDCASLPDTLVESHLFGHSRGAFTGADRAREGLLLAADKGTLFLDEVGDLPLAVQGAFLRALEQRRFRPVGELREVESDFRLVAATNRDLDVMVKEGRFRADLLYRLQGMTIRIPPLRRRRDEIPALARQAAMRFCLRNDLPEKSLAQPLMDILLDYPWPGNVRELIHCLERACLAAGKADVLLPAHLPTSVRVDAARRRLGGVERTAQPCASGPEPGKPERWEPAAGGLSRGQDAGRPTREAWAQGPAPFAPPAPPAARDAPAAPQAATWPEGDAPLPDLRGWKRQAEAAYVRRLWSQCGGDARKAAAVAGVSRGHWYELLKKHGAA